MNRDGSNSRGFSKIDLVVIVVCVVLLCGLLWEMLRPRPQADTARRVNCPANLYRLYKGLGSWGLDPSDPWRPPFPPTNMHVALKDMGITPIMFICPTAAGFGGSFPRQLPNTFPNSSINCSIGISPATNTAQITAKNCNYNYWTLRTEDDGDKVLVCDRNGLGNASNGPGMWGGNHDGVGGFYITVAGEAKWAGTNDILALDGAMFSLSSNEIRIGIVTNN